MEPELETLSPQLTLDTFAPSMLDGTVGPALPVVRDDAVVGIVGRRPGPDGAAGEAGRRPGREDVMVGGDDSPDREPG